MSASAFAKDVNCVGYQYGLQDRALITFDLDNIEGACTVHSNSAAWLQLKGYCNPDDYCAFKGHVVSEHNGVFTVDVIVGGINEDR